MTLLAVEWSGSAVALLFLDWSLESFRGADGVLLGVRLGSGVHAFDRAVLTAWVGAVCPRASAVGVVSHAGVDGVMRLVVTMLGVDGASAHAGGV